ncbi:outer membrane beta-barrel family protein [Lutibacter sp. TH_r2]|uniref:outer membrane beta-barrel family protein n=1 Tax=Lutibacter sp. TH_r2 TaxID=3082083 RepID=UPI002954E92D|nr:outer membrane beta-barrel family protein [Lutibacter sp. TH_r2]MDV7188397.1 outer membrane beta-barrel family protein [Lutibacter sp. TH_r2]
MRSIITILILIISVQIFGQPKPTNTYISKFKVSGTVIDKETKQPLEYATVVFTPLNNKQITGAITDANGIFNVEVTKGVYDISVEFISFKTKTFKNQTINSDKNLGIIPLEINAESLNEIEIIAEKSTVEIRLDKKIYNVGKDMTVKGGSASDVLDNVPSVTVDVEGNVSLRGNDNVRILVNGKPSGLVGLSGTDALRQLPADAIEKVEVITSPSARYDAEGTAGILNIVLRKGKATGFNGSISTSIGYPENYSVAANLNYRTKKFNLFTNSSYSYSNSPGNSLSEVTYLDDNDAIESYRNEVIEYNRERNRFNTRFGIEYFLSKKSSLTASVLYRDSDSDDIAENFIDEYNIDYLLSGETLRTENETEKDKVLEYSLNYTKDFNKSGHKLTLDFQYGNTEENEYAFITDVDTYPATVENDPERTETLEKEKEVQFKGDYTLPIGENAQFEFGFNIQLDDINTDYLVESYESGEFVNNTNYSNTLDFNQDIYAVYTQYGKKVNKFSYLFGLRAEKTERRINLLQTNEVYNKNFTEFFPTVNLGLEFSEDQSLTLGYSRRLRRPRHWFLNPFESLTSETYIRKGNVNLDPTYTNSFDIGFLKKWNKFTLNSSIYYQHSINNIEMIQEDEWRDNSGNTITDPTETSSLTKVIITTPVNLGTQDRYGFEFTANYNPFKWWRLSNSFNFFKSVVNGDYNNESFDSDDVTWFTRLTSRVSLPGGIDWQTRGMYRAPYESAQTKREGILSVNLAFSKDILKEKGTLSLNVSDLFNTRKRKSESYSATTYSYSEFQWRERQIKLNFTYRFNQKKQRQRSEGEFDGDGEQEMF